MLSAKGLSQEKFSSIRQKLIFAAWEMLTDRERSEWSSEAKRLNNEQLALRKLTPSPPDIDEYVIR